MSDWHALSAQLGPQSAAYMFSDEWEGALRSVACPCGALVEVIDDGPVASGDYLCESCTLRYAFTMEDATTAVPRKETSDGAH